MIPLDSSIDSFVVSATATGVVVLTFYDDHAEDDSFSLSPEAARVIANSLNQMADAAEQG